MSIKSLIKTLAWPLRAHPWNHINVRGISSCYSPFFYQSITSLTLPLPYGAAHASQLTALGRCKRVLELGSPARVHVLHSAHPWPHLAKNHSSGYCGADGKGVFRSFYHISTHCSQPLSENYHWSFAGHFLQW